MICSSKRLALVCAALVCVGVTAARAEPSSSDKTVALFQCTQLAIWAKDPAQAKRLMARALERGRALLNSFRNGEIPLERLPESLRQNSYLFRPAWDDVLLGVVLATEGRAAKEDSIFNFDSKGKLLERPEVDQEERVPRRATEEFVKANCALLR